MTREKWSTCQRTFRSAVLSNTESTGTTLGLNPNIRGKNPANDRLWHGGSEERANTTPGRRTFKALTPNFHDTPRFHRNTQREGLWYERLKVESQNLAFLQISFLYHLVGYYIKIMGEEGTLPFHTTRSLKSPWRYTCWLHISALCSSYHQAKYNIYIYIYIYTGPYTTFNRT